MKPQLIILSGSLESQTFSLADIETFTIGRAVKNQLLFGSHFHPRPAA
jgi:hypothetical protein